MDVQSQAGYLAPETTNKPKSTKTSPKSTSNDVTSEEEEEKAANEVSEMVDSDYSSDEDDVHISIQQQLKQFDKIAATGQLFLKYPPKIRLKPQDRIVKVSFDNKYKPKQISWGSGSRHIDFNEILYIAWGHWTPIFEARKDQLDEKLCFSVVGKQQILDVEAQSKEIAELWVKGLRKLIGHSDEKSDKLAKQALESGNLHKSNKNKDMSESKRTPREHKKRTKALMLLQQDLFVTTTTTVFRNLEEERIWDIDQSVRERFNAKSLYELALREDIPWRQWNHWVREKIVTYLRENNRIANPHQYGGAGGGPMSGAMPNQAMYGGQMQQQVTYQQPPAMSMYGRQEPNQARDQVPLTLKWDNCDVKEWISTVNGGKYKRYAAKFVENECDGDDIGLINDTMLRDEYEVKKPSHRRDILQEIKKLLQSTPETKNKLKATKTPSKQTAATHEEEEEKEETEIAKLLRRVNLEQYIDEFQANGFKKVKQLENITKLELEELSVTKMAHRKEIKREIHAYLNPSAGSGYNRELSQPIKIMDDALVIFFGIGRYQSDAYANLNVGEDYKCIKEAFADKYRFDIQCNNFENREWSKSDALEWIYKIRDDELCPGGCFRYNGLIFVAASHGSTHSIICSDSQELGWKQIRSAFARNVKHKFKNLPKIFLFNCCRTEIEQSRAKQSVGSAVDYSVTITGTEGNEVYGAKLARYVSSAFAECKEEADILDIICKATETAEKDNKGIEIRAQECDLQIKNVCVKPKPKGRGSPNAARKKDTRQSSPEKATKK